MRNISDSTVSVYSFANPDIEINKNIAYFIIV